MTTTDDILAGLEASRRAGWRAYYEEKRRGGEIEEYLDRLLHVLAITAETIEFYRHATSSHATREELLLEATWIVALTIEHGGTTPPLALRIARERGWDFPIMDQARPA